MSPKIDNLASVNSILKVQRFLQKHFYLLLLIPLIAIVLPIAKPGISITGDFPYLDSPDYAAKRLSMWIETGSIDGFEFLPRFPILGMWDLLSYVYLTTEIGTKAMIVLGFLLSSFSFYFSYLKFFRDKFPNLDFTLKISAVLGSLFYAYNVWSFNRVHHWYLWIGYAVFPIFFVSVLYSLKNPKDWKWIISTVFFWTVASSTPHMTVFCGIVFIVLSLAFILSAAVKHKRKEKLIQLAIPIVLIIGCYVLVNLYWIYPYFLASKTGSINPNYEFTEENINLLSRYSNFLNTIRGMAYWINLEVIRAYDSTPFFNLWLGASFVVPIVAFLSLLVKKSIKQSIVFSIVAVIGIFFAMGTRSPVNYYDLMLSTPVIDKLVWLLRDPDKMTFFITFSYSFLIGLFSFKFLTRLIKNRSNKRNLIVATSFIILLVGSISITAYPYYIARLAPLEPIVLPKEFDELNKFLSSSNPDRVYFVPYPMEETQWDQNGRVATIYQTHSIKPSIESTEYNPSASNYYNFFVNYVMNNKSKDVDNLLHPLGTSYLIFHNDTWSKTLDKYNQENIKLLKNLNQLDDIKNVKDIGFYNIFKTSDSNSNKAIRQVNIPSQNMLVVGGLDTYASLNSLTSFNSLQSSVQFSDNILLKNKNIGPQDFNQLILYGSPSYDDLALSLVGDKYIVVPTQSTIRDDPATAWSKSSTNDPINAEFHSRLRSLGMSNWDLDYGKGLIITKSMGVNISIPVNIQDIKETNDDSTETFQLFVRLLENQKGGAVNIYFDGELMGHINTYDKISNNFKWISLGPLHALDGKHTLTLQNVAGFNAVNILAIVPPNEMARIKSEVSNLITNKIQIAYLMEAESSFHDDEGNDTGMQQYLYKRIDNKNDEEPKNTTNKNIEGQFSVPYNADLATIKFNTTNNNNTTFTQSSIANVTVYPLESKHTVYSAGFELSKNNFSMPLGKLRQLEWINSDKDIVSTSIDSRNPLDGNYSLSVHTKPAQREGWNILSTDFIPIRDDRYYNNSLHISATDVSQLHSRVLYFDSQKRLLSDGTDYIFRTRDGTFRDNFASSILPPLDASYLKLQVLTLSDNPKPSSYAFDDVKLEEISIPKSEYKNGLIFKLDSKQNGLLNNASQYNSTANGVIQTEPFALNGVNAYKYVISLPAKLLDPNSILVNFKNSTGITSDSKYGTNASQGEVLSLSSGSDIAGDLNILKASNYALAIKASTCESCTFLSAYIVRKSDDGIGENLVHTSNLNLSTNVTGLHWLLSDEIFLSPGEYKIRIHANSQTDLDSVVVYSTRADYSVKNKPGNDKLGLFGVNDDSSDPYISSYKKIDSTKHVVTIKNATHPHIISFAESYDPFWTAYATDSNTGDGLSTKDKNFKVNSIPLYGVTNGFYINKTGNYDLVIEYEPQKWFIQGSVASTISVVVILLSILFVIKKEILRWPYLQILRKMKQQK